MHAVIREFFITALDKLFYQRGFLILPESVLAYKVSHPVQLIRRFFWRENSRRAAIHRKSRGGRSKTTKFTDDVQMTDLLLVSRTIGTIELHTDNEQAAEDVSHLSCRSTAISNPRMRALWPLKTSVSKTPD
jgi:hypothetical protein